MSAAAGPVEPERNFLFARTLEIPAGARPRRCADNTNAAVARSHRLCPFASCSLARARAPPVSPCHGDGCPSRTDRARRHSTAISSSLDVARRATIDRAGRERSRVPATARPATSRPRGRSPRRERPSTTVSSSRPPISRKRRDRRVARSHARTKSRRPRGIPLAPPMLPASPSRAPGPPSLALAPAPARPPLRLALRALPLPTPPPHSRFPIPSRACSFPLPRSLYSSWNFLCCIY